MISLLRVPITRRKLLIISDDHEPNVTARTLCDLLSDGGHPERGRSSAERGTSLPNSLSSGQPPAVRIFFVIPTRERSETGGIRFRFATELQDTTEVIPSEAALQRSEGPPLQNSLSAGQPPIQRTTSSSKNFLCHSDARAQRDRRNPLPIRNRTPRHNGGHPERS